jgi:TIR domain
VSVTQDLFISHAGADKSRFIEPMSKKLAEYGVTFWLDNIEIAWGDNVPMRINDGLRHSSYLLLCLSPRFLCKNWPEAELSAMFSVQTDTGKKRILPLILEGKDQVLSEYPLLSSLAYREYTQPTETAKLIADFIGKIPKDASDLKILIESVHTGSLCNLRVPPNVSVRWLTDQAKRGVGVSEEAVTGAYMSFRVRWVLIDVRVEEEWLAMPRWKKREIYALLRVGDQTVASRSETDRLSKIGIEDGITFHMYAIEDEDFDPPCLSMP